MAKVRIGIIGCGKIVQVRHAPEYQENPNVEIIGFYDLVSERTQQMAAQYGGKACASLDELLALKPDAVSVCNANVAHAETCIKCLNAGVNVLCEKPMAMSPEECEAIMEAQKQSGKFLMVAQNQRFNKSHVMARDLIKSGAVGKPLTFHTCFAHAGPENWTGVAHSWFTDRKMSVFGVVADLGIHKVDLMHFLLGEYFTKVSGHLCTLDKKDAEGNPISVEDNAFCILESESGVVGQLHISWTDYGRENNSTVIYCTEGNIRCYDDSDYSLIIEHRDGTVEKLNPDQMMTNNQQNSGGRVSTGVIDAFVDCVMTNTPPTIDAREATAALKVVFAADKSYREGRVMLTGNTHK